MRGTAKLPIHRLKKSELVWLGTHNCKEHSHSYLSHYNCYLKDNPVDSPMHERVGVFDIETTGLKANWSHLLCWCLRDQNNGIIREDLITRTEARDKDDKRIVQSAVNEIMRFDRTMGWYSSRFDMPYVRSRAIYHNIEFPGYKEHNHTDLYYIARSKLALHSNRLGSVCQFFGITAKNHPMTPDLWQRAGSGNEEALKEILIHCQEDVDSTAKVYDLLKKYTAGVKRSI